MEIIELIRSESVAFQKVLKGGWKVSTALKKVNGEILIDLKGHFTFADLKENLAAKLGSIEDYMLGTMVSIDVGSKHLSSKQVREIEDILLDHGLHLKEIMTNGPPGRDPGPEDKPLLEGMQDYEKTILICRNLRSGQKLFSEGNVVVLGDINPGAEVVAAGNIVVMGSLRGMAHAGCQGDDLALIAAYRLNPTQIRISNHITRPPDGETAAAGCPEVARIRDGKVMIEKLKI